MAEPSVLVWICIAGAALLIVAKRLRGYSVISLLGILRNLSIRCLSNSRVRLTH